MAGKIIGELLRKDNIITTDMGGTSFDVSLIANGEIHYTKKSYHERHAVATPMADIESIGAGGGSIAYVEKEVPDLLWRWRRQTDGHRCEPDLGISQSGLFPGRENAVEEGFGRERSERADCRSSGNQCGRGC
jgi:hypothetical protein